MHAVIQPNPTSVEITFSDLLINSLTFTLKFKPVPILVSIF